MSDSEWPRRVPLPRYEPERPDGASAWLESPPTEHGKLWRFFDRAVSDGEYLNQCLATVAIVLGVVLAVGLAVSAK